MIRAVVFLSFVLCLAACPPSGIVCREGTNRCGNGCADYQSDKRNCGDCGKACFAGQVCSGGQCLCQAGTQLCDGQCVVPETDPGNCGQCGNRCGTDQVCEMGACRIGCTIVTNTECSGSCVDLATDALNCGGCGVACDAPQSCRAGKCAYDVVAACFSTGQLVGVQASSGLRGPLQPAGTGPVSLATFGGNTVLALDGLDRRLNQATLYAIGATPPLTALSTFTRTGAVPNHVITDTQYAYVVNSETGTLQVLQANGACMPPAPVDAGCVGAVTLADGGMVTPTLGDGGCALPSANDGGCFQQAQSDGGSEPLPLDDGGCFVLPPPPMQPVNPCPDQLDSGTPFSTVGELAFGANTYPQAIARTGDTLWIPLYGGIGSAAAAAGQKIAQVNVSNRTMPTLTGTIDLGGVDLRADGGPSVPRPYAATAVGSNVYVPLNNLDPDTYEPRGPGIVVRIDSATAMVTGTWYLEQCLNPVWVAPIGTSGAVAVSCAGKATYSPPTYALSDVQAAGVALINPDGGIVTWNVNGGRCTDGDAGCAFALPSRFAVQGSTIWMGDQNAGRLFALDVTNGVLVEKRGFSVGGPVNACGVSAVTGIGNVADVLVVP